MWLCGALSVTSSLGAVPRGRWESGLKSSARKMYKKDNYLSMCCIRRRCGRRWGPYHLVQLSLQVPAPIPSSLCLPSQCTVPEPSSGLLRQCFSLLVMQSSSLGPELLKLVQFNFSYVCISSFKLKPALKQQWHLKTVILLSTPSNLPSLSGFLDR